MTTADLLAEIEVFLARQNERPGVRMTESTFGRLAVNDGKFVGRLRDGKGITLDTLEKARAFMARREPDASSPLSVVGAHP
jgi:hypothetical protein